MIVKGLGQSRLTKNCVLDRIVTRLIGHQHLDLHDWGDHCYGWCKVAASSFYYYFSAVGCFLIRHSQQRACFLWRQQSWLFWSNLFTAWTHKHEFQLSGEGMSGVSDPVNAASEQSECSKVKRCGASERLEQTNIASDQMALSTRDCLLLKMRP